MKAIKPLLLSLSMFALAGGAAQAADEKKSDTQAKPSMSQSGSASGGATGSKSASGSTAASGSASTGATGSSGSSKSPSASGGASGSGSAAARYDFDKADKNKDGQLSRQEFNDMMKASASAGGSTSGAGQTSAGQTSGSTSAKTQTPSSGKMDDKPKTK